MVRKIKNISNGVKENYEFNEISVDNKFTCPVMSSELDTEKDIEQITYDVNKSVHKTDIYWESYKSIMTRTILPLQLYRDYIKQYDNFIDAVKHYYYDDNFSDYYLFTNVINSLQTSKSKLENLLSDELFKSICYPIDKLIEHIKNTFLGDHFV